MSALASFPPLVFILIIALASVLLRQALRAISKLITLGLVVGIGLGAVGTALLVGIL
ncbi:MAG: hypothetical protein ACRDRN_26665 [Sciscionella sp.]